MSFPESILQRGKFLKQSARRYALEAIDQLRKLMRWLYSHHNMNVINFCFNGYEAATGFIDQDSQYLLESVADLSGQYRATVFHAPNNVVGEQIDRMAATFKFIFDVLRIPKTNNANNGFMPYLCGVSVMQPRAAFIPDQDKTFWSGTSAGDC
jgi:hypothetical protein